MKQRKRIRKKNNVASAINSINYVRTSHNIVYLISYYNLLSMKPIKRSSCATLE